MWPDIVILTLVLLTGVGVGFLMGWILKTAENAEQAENYGKNS